MKIAILDDHKLFAEGLLKLIEEKIEDVEINTFSEPKEFLSSKYLNQLNLLFLDLSMPEVDGFAVLKTLQNAAPNLKVIVISMHDEPAFIQPAIKEPNLFGYLLKTDSQKEIVSAITAAKNQKRHFSNSVAEIIKQGEREKEEQVWFTSRELEILRLLNEGLNVVEIAKKLGIEKSTVETHKKNMVKKAGVNSALKLLNYARKLNYL